MPETENIWIIGASEGIGAALAREWARRGARLVLSARSSGRLGELAAELGPEHVALPLDVTDRGSIDTATAKISRIAALDRVVNMAALYDPGKVADLDPDTAAQIVSTNLMGTFHIAQVAPHLLRDGGQLALCGSVAGYFGLPLGQIYSATKAGVINLAESLRSELAEQVDVRLICPGFVDTRLTQRNEFQMPAIVTPEFAACAIIDGLNSRTFEVHFPRRLTWSLKLLRALPYWAALPLARRVTQ